MRLSITWDLNAYSLAVCEFCEPKLSRLWPASCPFNACAALVGGPTESGLVVILYGSLKEILLPGVHEKKMKWKPGQWMNPPATSGNVALSSPELTRRDAP